MPQEDNPKKKSTSWNGPVAAFWASFILTMSLWISLFLYTVLTVFLVPEWYLKEIQWPAAKAFNALLYLFKMTPFLMPPVMIFLVIAYDKEKPLPPSWVFQVIGMFIAFTCAYFFFCPGYFM